MSASGETHKPTDPRSSASPVCKELYREVSADGTQPVTRSKILKAFREKDTQVQRSKGKNRLFLVGKMPARWQLPANLSPARVFFQDKSKGKTVSDTQR